MVEARHDPLACHCGQAARKVILTAPRVFGDFEGYESPASGRWIEGRRARLEDFARTGTRPYELGERQEMEKRQADNDRRMDQAVDEAVERTLNEMTL
jgi:hypothetical protein